MLDAGELAIIGRTIFSYIVIVVIFRLMGKREIGELSIIDLVVYLMLAEIAVFSIEDPTSEVMHFLVPMVLLLLIQWFTAWLSLKFPLFRGLMDGKPSVIISRGKIDEREMKKQRYNFSDLLQQLRENGTKSVEDVDFAILEPSGNLSIFEKQTKENGSSGYVLPVILDGSIQYEALEKINHDADWLRQQLKKKGYHKLEDISFCSVDKENNWHIDKKDS